MTEKLVVNKYDVYEDHPKHQYITTPCSDPCEEGLIAYSELDQVIEFLTKIRDRIANESK